MTRDLLKTIIGGAADAALVAPEDRARLVATAAGIDKVLIGEFSAHVEGQHCGCPATLAGLYLPDLVRWAEETWRPDRVGVHEFPRHFDQAMIRGGHHKRDPDDGSHYVEVTDA